jgi:hypothetical protein
MKSARLCILFLCLIACCVPITTAAKLLTCAELRAGLDGTTKDLSVDYGSILLGVVQTKPDICVPNGTMLGVLSAVFVHWADTHPEYMAIEAWKCATKGLQQSYPCQKSR